MTNDQLQLLLRSKAAKILDMGVSTMKRRERSDPEFPKPIALSANRIAYRAADVLRYQQALARRPQSRPAVANDAREAAAQSVVKRQQKAKAKKIQQRKAETAKSTAERPSAASSGNGSQRKPDLPGDVPAAAEPKRSKRTDQNQKIPAPVAQGTINPLRSDGRGSAEVARDEADEPMER